MEYVISALFWVLVIAAVFYNLVIKKGKNRRLAQSGEDMARVKKAVQPLLAQEGDCKLVYAHWEEQEHYGRTVKTTYFRYALAFREDTLLVIPLGIDKKTGQMQIAKPMRLGPDTLGKITVKTKEKNGAVSSLDLWLGDKKGHVISQLTIDAENLKKNRWFPVNIAQQDECAAFQRFITTLAQRVAKENPGVDALIEAESNEGLGSLGAIISGISLIVGFFVAPAGLVVCLIGLLMAIVSKVKGAKGSKSLIFCSICTVALAAFTVFFFKYIV